MPRFHNVTFAVALATLSWLLMQAAHELGHVFGAIVTGGHVEQVVLHPIQISRTDVSPNPRPAVVVWFGPILGCLLPLALFFSIPVRYRVFRQTTEFFAGFCLIANGAYISIGSFAGIGDCAEMLRTGTPYWAMYAFGLVTVPAGLYVWHRLGSPKEFLYSDKSITPQLSYFSVTMAAIVLLIAFTFA